MSVFSAALLPIFACFLLVCLASQVGGSNAAGSGQAVAVVGACAERQAFQLDTQPDTGPGPHFVVTNLCEQPLTAFFLENFSPDDGKTKGGQLWDALMPHRAPIAKGENVSGPLGHVVGQPFSDTVEVTAGIWADGSTFGNPERLKRILSNRAAELRSYDWTISLVQKGLQQNWTRDQYLAELDQYKSEGHLPGYAAATLRANLQNFSSDDSPNALYHVLQRLTGTFTQMRDMLRQSKPELSAAGNPK